MASLAHFITFLVFLATLGHGFGNTVRSSIPRSYIDSILNQVRSSPRPMDAVLIWNLVTLQANANDYDKAIVTKRDQEGPVATSRAFAIIHGSMFRAMTSFDRTYDQVIGGSGATSLDLTAKISGAQAAIIEAAYQTLSDLYPQQRTIFTAVYEFHLNQLRTNTTAHTEIQMGLSVGHLTASHMLESRQSDGSDGSAMYMPSMVQGYHQPDPTRPQQGFLGVHWGRVKPFYISSATHYRLPSTVGNTTDGRLRYLNSSTYARDLLEVKSLGSKTSIDRTDDQTRIGIFWAYDGAPRIGTPPRLYNQVARTIAIQRWNTLEQNARLFALINYAMADAGIAAWDSKYYFSFWRPIVGIRRSTHPFHRDPTWEPLGSPADGDGDNFTPGFPAYVSGHAAFGSSVFEMLRQFYGTDHIPFSFQSDEYNGRTKDSNTGLVRPALNRSYPTLTSAEAENAISRIYLGVHWRSDAEHGQYLGTEVAKEVFRRFY